MNTTDLFGVLGILVGVVGGIIAIFAAFFAVAKEGSAMRAFFGLGLIISLILLFIIGTFSGGLWLQRHYAKEPPPVDEPTPPPIAQTSPSPTRAPSPAIPTPTATPSPSPSPTATSTPKPRPTPTPAPTPFPRGYYYVTIVNRSATPVTYEAMNDSKLVQLKPYGTHWTTHWWSSPAVAKIRRVDTGSSKRRNGPWQLLETRYFSHTVPPESNERDLIPVYEFTDGDDDARLSGASDDAETDSQPKGDDFKSPAREKADDTWTYYVEFSNKTGVELTIEYLRAGKWVEGKVPRNGGSSVGSDTYEMKVRICDCEDLRPAAPEWPVRTTEQGKNVSTIVFEFYRNRSGKVDLRRENQ